MPNKETFYEKEINFFELSFSIASTQHQLHYLINFNMLFMYITQKNTTLNFA